MDLDGHSFYYPACLHRRFFGSKRGGTKRQRWLGSENALFRNVYNPQTVETISGEVVSVDQISPMKGMSHGVHLMVKTDKETISVHMGPAWFNERQDIQIEPKDHVEVTGSRITFKGEPAIIAKEVKKGDHILILRDEKGFPVWSGWRRK